MRWKRFVAVSCNHGQHASANAVEEFFRFVRDYKPHTRIHLGDFLDTTAWRAGARGSDEGTDVRSDFDAGLGFLRRYEPQLVFLGNHDARPWRMLAHPSALLRSAGEGAVREISDCVTKELRAELVPYDIRRGWRIIGGTAFGHGYMFSENALRDHVEMLGRPVVMGHLHRVMEQVGRVMGAPTGHCIGWLGDVEKMNYASTRRATTTWANGWAFGEYCGDRIRVNLHRCAARLEIGAAKLVE